MKQKNTLQVRKILTKQWKILKNQPNFIYRNSEKTHINRRISSGRVAMLFITPSLLGVSVFVLIPFMDVIRRSFISSGSSRFVGFHNYIEVFRNEAFQLAMENTLKFTVICVPLLVICSLLLAVVVTSVKTSRDFWKTSFLIPMAVPAASVVLIWKFLFQPDGLINGILASLGFETIEFMQSNAAFWVLVISYLWRNMGYDMILWLAGLSCIPKDLYEAADLDGAGAVKSFFFITLPNLFTICFTIFVLSLLNSFKVFREAYLVAGEHPHTSMYMLQHLFNNWFTGLDIEKLCAGAVLLSILIFGLILLLQKAWGEKYD